MCVHSKIQSKLQFHCTKSYYERIQQLGGSYKPAGIMYNSTSMMYNISIITKNISNCKSHSEFNININEKHRKRKE